VSIAPESTGVENQSDQRHSVTRPSAYFEAGFFDLNRSDAVTYSKGEYRSPFDRILVPREQSEFRYAFQYVLTPAKPAAHLDRLSDHYLVLAGLRVLDDDD
jgi:hypothetical protein